MRRKRIGTAAAALAALALVAVACSAAAISSARDGGPERAKGKTVTVAVADDYFAPTDVKIKKNSKVKWRWDDLNTDTHDVVLTKKRPKGVKKSDFHSSSGAIGIKFARKFKVPGTYGFICTFHRTVMKMNVKVKKK